LALLADGAGAAGVRGTVVLVEVLMTALWAYLNNFPKY